VGFQETLQRIVGKTRKRHRRTCCAQIEAPRCFVETPSLQVERSQWNLPKVEAKSCLESLTKNRNRSSDKPEPEKGEAKRSAENPEPKIDGRSLNHCETKKPEPKG
jgi:hypothetical protein